MVRATRQYGRWLRDNYADLEHKEVWHSLVVLVAFLLGFSFYAFELHGLFYKYASQVNEILLTCFLVWRVETLSDLRISTNEAKEETAIMALEEDNDHILSMRNNIGPLLKQHCEESQLYLQSDISLTKLAKQIGTNRMYLSRHFACRVPLIMPTSMVCASNTSLTFTTKRQQPISVQHYSKWSTRVVSIVMVHLIEPSNRAWE